MAASPRGRASPSRTRSSCRSTRAVRDRRRRPSSSSSCYLQRSERLARKRLGEHRAAGARICRRRAPVCGSTSPRAFASTCGRERFVRRRTADRRAEALRAADASRPARLRRSRRPRSLPPACRASSIASATKPASERVVGALPVDVPFPEFGPSIFLAAELTAEARPPVVDLACTQGSGLAGEV